MSSEVFSFIPGVTASLGTISGLLIAGMVAFSLTRPKQVTLEQCLPPMEKEYGAEPQYLSLTLTKEVKETIARVSGYAADYQGPSREHAMDLPLDSLRVNNRPLAKAKVLCFTPGEVRFLYGRTEHGEEYTHAYPLGFFNC